MIQWSCPGDLGNVALMWWRVRHWRHGRDEGMTGHRCKLVPMLTMLTFPFEGPRDQGG